MKHLEFEKLVNKFEGLQSPSEEQEVSRHLQACARCAARAAKLESSIGFEVLDPQLLPDESLIQIEQEKQIEEALAAIDERCRRLLTLLYLHQQQIPYAEIAQMLDIPLGSIGPTRARCLEKLIKLLPK